MVDFHFSRRSKNIVVPHIHPTHNIHVNQINYENQHSYPQTQSTVDQVTSFKVNVGISPSVAGAFSLGPGQGMGMGPKQGPSFYER